MNRTGRFWLGAACAALSTGLMGGTAAAQDGATEADQGEDVILVTAQRRPQTLVEVPMSITAITSEELEKRGIIDFLDYAVSVPSLSFGFNGTEARGNRNTIAIRGVSGTNTTGYYIDDTPVPYGVDPRLFDIARVEVLRGPQGTLYGSGSMGGTVKVVTEAPDTTEMTIEGIGDTSFTQEGGGNAEVAFIANMPIAQDLAALRLSGYYERQSGIYDRIYGEELPYYPEAPTPSLSGVEEDVDSSDVYGFRAALAFTPTERLEIVPSFYWQQTNEDGATQADTDPEAFEQFRVYNISEPYDENYTLANLTARYDLGFAQFTSSTSHFNRRWKEVEDITEVIDTFFRGAYADPTAPPFPMPIFNNRNQERFTQELRLSGGGERFDWLVGGFYQWVDTQRLASLVPEGQAADPRYADFGVNDVFFVSNDSAETTELAAFVDVTWRITERIDVSGGVRLFDNEFEFMRDSGGLFDAGLQLSDLTQSETGTTPRAAIRYAIDERTSIYATAAQGFRLGGTNTPLPPTCADDLAALNVTTPDSFDSDTLWNYEAGVKAGSLLGGALSVDAAFFQIDWSDIQQNVRLPGCGFSFTNNVGEARIRGFEIEAVYSPRDDLTLTFSLSQNDSEIVDAGEGTAAEDGDELLSTPEWKAAASLEYDFMFATRPAFVRVDYQYFGEAWSTFNQDDPDNVRETLAFLPRDSFQIVNARVNVIFDDVTASLYVDNVLNEHANLSDARSIGLEFPGRPRFVTNRPRTVGVRARVTF